MLSRPPARVVRVTSKEELDSALVSADQVIVEGNDELLSYAATKASQDSELSKVEIEITNNIYALAERDHASGLYNIDGLDERDFLDPKVAPLPPQPSLPRSRLIRRILVLGFSIAFALMVLPTISWLFFVAPSSDSSPNLPLPNPPPPPSPTTSSVPQILEAIVWPTVAIVAIIALFFIARQAIAGGRNVEISWKVTEKVTGRMVITKVRSKASNARSAA
jgi:hypothetical protein